MSLEQALAENTKAYLANTVAVNALTELLKGQPIKEVKLTGQTDAKSDNEPPKETKPEVKIDTSPTQPLEKKPEVKEPITVPTLEEITKPLMDLAKKDRNSAVAVVTQFKVSKASEVPEEERAAFLQAINERLQNIQG